MKKNGVGRSREGLNHDTEPVEVMCRLRPIKSSETDICATVVDDQTIRLDAPPSFVEAKGEKTTINRFTQVFPEDVDQKEMFDRVALDLVRDLIQGKNGLLFAYGITGSGKTFTMTGNPGEPGILPRCLDVLFNSVTPYLAGKYVHRPDGGNRFRVTSERSADLERQKDSIPYMTPATPGTRPSPLEWEQVERMVEIERIRDINEDNAYTVFVSYVEIYNNYIYDLLDSAAEKENPPRSKGIREDVTGQTYVDKVTEVEVRSTDEAFDCFIKGQRLRRVAHTVLNAESSRSHSVFNVRLVQTPLDSTGTDVIRDKTKVHISQLSLVDLAGSERSNRTGHGGERMRETSLINQSLMTLRHCIAQLRENQTSNRQAMVPYRDSKLTYLFRNFFDGKGKVRMIVCLNPGGEDYDENLHVMQFSEMTQEVEVQRGMEIHCDDGLTPGRRRAAKFHRQVLDLLGEGSSPQKRPRISDKPTVLFNRMPNLQLNGPTDDETFRSLKIHFEKRLLSRQSYLTEENTKAHEFSQELRVFVFDSEKTRFALEELEVEHKELEAENKRINGELKQRQHQIKSMTQRLNKYEFEARSQGDKEEALRRKEREMAARVQSQNQKLATVKAIFEQPTNTPTPRGGTSEREGRRVRGTSSRPGSPSGRGPSRRGASPARFGGSQDQLNKRNASPGRGNKKNLVAAGDVATSSRNIGSLYPRLPANTAGDNEWMDRARVKGKKRAPSPPPRTGASSRNIPHVNYKSRTHRRSKSAGFTIDHQPARKVPGDLMDSSFPENSSRKVKRKPSLKDLKQASEYCLTNQDCDSDNGYLRTSLYKGTVHETVSGGAAVVFQDVEQLRHVTPTTSS